jgi:hypothetical protein
LSEPSVSPAVKSPESDTDRERTTALDVATVHGNDVTTPSSLVPFPYPASADRPFCTGGSEPMTIQTDVATAQPADEHETAPSEAPVEVVAPPVGEAAAQALHAVLIRAAVAHRNAERAKEADAAASADVVSVLGRGGSLPVMNPLNAGEEFVQVTVSKLTYSAKTVDPAATKEWIKERYAEKVETRRRLSTKFTEQQVIEILEDLAPFLLETIEVVPDHVLNELQQKSRRAQQPIGFGGEVGEDAPPGIVVEPSIPQVRITFRNAAIVDDLIVSGVVDMEGNLLGGAQ